MTQRATGADTDLDVDIDLSLAGDSPHELAASAQGDIFMELKNGFFRRDLIDLVFADIIGWAWTKTTRDNYYQLGCTIADFSVEQGVMTTRAFLLDGNSLAVTGDGTIDLGEEQLDYVFVPKKKSRIAKADPVKVTGALNDPSVKVIPWKSATTTYGPLLLFGPFIFAGVTAVDYLGGKILDKEKESPCLVYERKLAERSGESATQ